MPETILEFEFETFLSSFLVSVIFSALTSRALLITSKTSSGLKGL